MTIDLRSDTVTRPTEQMKQAMFQASVGDDVFKEDETVNALEQKAAEMFGMENALFCPSGTMTNQIAIKIHTQPGDEVICDRQSHIYNYEGGGIAFNSGCSVRLLHGERGLFTAEDVAQNINNPEDVHLPLTRLVSVENTCNRGGGSIYDFEELKKIGEVCRKYGLKYHIDGARLFNALVETPQTPRDYGKIFDTISICLSKGLGCPIGSLLIGNKQDIKKARRVRKVFGGGMRQAGYLAAAGIYALDHHIDRLKEDHRKAREIAKVLENLPFVKTVLPVETNIVVFDLKDGIERDEFLKKLKQKNILAIAFGPQRVRMVTHLDIKDEMLEKLFQILQKIV